jgi:hypothetical protein
MFTTLLLILYISIMVYGYNIVETESLLKKIKKWTKNKP